MMYQKATFLGHPRQVSTEYVLNQLMKQNQILVNLLTLQNAKANSEPKVIPVVLNLNKTIPSFTDRSNS